MPLARRAEELLEHFTGDQLAYRECWAVAGILNDCVLPDGWEGPDELTHAIHLRREGTEWATWLTSNDGGSYEWQAAKLAVFAAWGREALFVDVDATDIGQLLKSLSEELRTSRIRLGNPFGRYPDDVFTRQVGEWRRLLSQSETERFLERTPQGVSQIGHLVFGPMGLLRSAEQRIISPTRMAAGFLCTDPGCLQIHAVALQTGRSQPSRALAALRQHLLHEGHQSSEWGGLFRRLVFTEPTWYSEHFPAILPALIANGFSDNERALLLSNVLSASPAIRTALAQTDVFQNLAQGSVASIVDPLSPEESLHLLLAEQNGVLIETLERLISEGDISIPPTEVRQWRFCRARIPRGALGVNAEASRHGIRFEPRAGGPAVNMRWLLRSVYDDDTRDLDWSLRHVEGLELEERLGKFIESEEPRKIATDLLLASPGRLERALDLLSPGYFDDVRSPDREDRLLDKILWKLGFDVHGYQDYLPRFHERLTKFQESVDPSDAIAPETARDEIRGAGNNLFVSLEEVLDSAISFITWGLLFDHVAERRSGFDFNLADAREFTSDRLNAELAEETKRVPLDPSGKNTLDPLAAGFATLAELLEGLQDEEEALRRPTSDLPSWARYSTYEVFPFAHTVPWLDLTTESRNVIVDAVRSVPQVLSRNDVTRVRNQVAHRRDDFPTGNEVHRVTTALRELVNHLEDTGVLPNVYIREQRRTDLYGRALVTMRDYSGRTVQIAWPSEIGRTGVPSLAGPQTIITCSVISGTAEPLRFRIEEDSEYRRMWAKWPSELHRPEGDGAGERSQPPDSNTPDQVQESFDNTLEAA